MRVREGVLIQRSGLTTLQSNSEEHLSNERMFARFYADVSTSSSVSPTYRIHLLRFTEEEEISTGGY